MKIVDIIEKNTIEIDFDVKSKDELLDKMIDLISNSSEVTNKNEAKKEILTRESIMSTGIGKGFALPHAKTSAVNSSVGSLTLLKKPIDYNSLDSKPVNIVFMLLSKDDNVTDHLRLLSKISRIMNDDTFRDKLQSLKSKEEIIALFNNYVD